MSAIFPRSGSRDQEHRQSAIDELKALLDKAEASGISDLTMDQIREKARKDIGL